MRVAHTGSIVTAVGSVLSTSATRSERVRGSSSHSAIAVRATAGSVRRPIARRSSSWSCGSRQARLPSERVSAKSGPYRPRAMPASTQPRSRSKTIASCPARSTVSKRRSTGTLAPVPTRSIVSSAHSRNCGTATWCCSTSAASVPSAVVVAADASRASTASVVSRVSPAAVSAVSSGAVFASAPSAAARTGSCSLRSRPSRTTTSATACGSRERRAAPTSSG
ncbi:hypothetical protein [Micromonospora sp. NPDC047074]|uniref:hypothetical protein n=1 Tax=Micromonospora sp. NPDC047074 TaxID=3154339 RepID=UPI0034063568